MRIVWRPRRQRRVGTSDEIDLLSARLSQGLRMAVRDYEILVSGEFGRRHCVAFEDLSVSVSGGHTLLSARLPDQAALYGVLRRLEDLGLEIIDIHSAVPTPESGQS
jgi:hypothetical protein